jgi:hypothetical protein
MVEEKRCEWIVDAWFAHDIPRRGGEEKRRER